MNKVNKRKVLLVPDYREGNPYQDLLTAGFDESLWSFDFAQFPHNYFPLNTLLKRYPKTEVIHMHWIAQLLYVLSWTSSPRKAKLRCILLAIDCLLARARGCRVVWTIHNKFAHEKFDRRIELFLRKLLCWSVSDIIVHSESANKKLQKAYKSWGLEHKKNVIFHGNYEGVYPPRQKDRMLTLRQFSVTPKQRVFLCMGMVRPYKGIEFLIDTFRQYSNAPSSVLLVAGKAEDKNYAKKLEAESMGCESIKLHFDFLSDQSLVDLLCACDVVSIPFSDTLTSGSVLLAMTYGKALILPEVSRVLGCVPPAGVKYYNNKQEYWTILDSLSESEIESMGNANRKAASQMDWKQVATMTAKVYGN